MINQWYSLYSWVFVRLFTYLNDDMYRIFHALPVLSPPLEKITKTSIFGLKMILHLQTNLIDNVKF